VTVVTKNTVSGPRMSNSAAVYREAARGSRRKLARTETVPHTSVGARRGMCSRMATVVDNSRFLLIGGLRSAALWGMSSELYGVSTRANRAFAGVPEEKRTYVCWLSRAGVAKSPVGYGETGDYPGRSGHEPAGRSSRRVNLANQPFFFFFPPPIPIAVRHRALTLLALLCMHAESC